LNCPHCGHSLAEGAAFCAGCGRTVSVPAAPPPAPTAEPASVATLIEPGAGVWAPPSEPGPAPEPVLAVQPPTPPQPAVQIPRIFLYAGFWKRFVAFVIDFLTLGMAQYLVLIALGLQVEISPDDPRAPGRSFVVLIVWWIYYAVLESSPLQASLGKRALDLAVTDLNGNRISFWRATARFWCKVISAIPLLVGFFMIPFTEKCQGLHDVLSGCLVLRRDD